MSRFSGAPEEVTALRSRPSLRKSAPFRRFFRSLCSASCVVREGGFWPGEKDETLRNLTPLIFRPVGFVAQLLRNMNGFVCLL